MCRQASNATPRTLDIEMLPKIIVHGLQEFSHCLRGHRADVVVVVVGGCLLTTD